VIDVQRVGPSTGMPTRTQQGDILECAYASHGDTKHILLFPANPAECFEFAPSASIWPSVSDAGLHAVRSRYRHERLGHAEAHLGRFVPPDRGKVLTAEQLELIAKFYRYLPENGTRSRRARCRACIRKARSSRAARATTSSAATPKFPTSIRK
jgi:2-oxoglutarate ferredoxin oxidoreductase subunit alpha